MGVDYFYNADVLPYESRIEKMRIVVLVSY